LWCLGGIGVKRYSQSVFLFFFIVLIKKMGKRKLDQKKNQHLHIFVLSIFLHSNTPALWIVFYSKKKKPLMSAFILFIRIMIIYINNYSYYSITLESEITQWALILSYPDPERRSKGQTEGLPLLNNLMVSSIPWRQAERPKNNHPTER